MYVVNTKNTSRNKYNSMRHPQKSETSKSNIIELTKIDKGESYCLMVQAVIPSREHGKQNGEFSNTKCTTKTNKDIFDGKSPERQGKQVRPLKLNSRLGLHTRPKLGPSA